MGPEYPVLAAIALSFYLQGVCEYVGPDHPEGWDYDCGIATVQPVPNKPEPALSKPGDK